MRTWSPWFRDGIRAYLDDEASSREARRVSYRGGSKEDANWRELVVYSSFRCFSAYPWSSFWQCNSNGDNINTFINMPIRAPRLLVIA